MNETYNFSASGRSAGWLAHQHGGLGVGGSSPLAPMFNFLIIVPVYNEEHSLPQLIDTLLNLNLIDKTLFIDDGSTDKTPLILNEKKVNVIRLDKNQGKGFAQRVGFEEAIKRGAEAVVTLDGDLQHNPSLINKFISLLKEHGYDIVIGSRWKELHKMPRDRYLSNRLTTLAISLLCRKKIQDSQSGFRAYRRNVIDEVKFKSNKFEAESELLIKAIIKGMKVGYVSIEANYEVGQGSKIHRLKDTLRFLKMYFGLVWKKS